LRVVCCKERTQGESHGRAGRKEGERSGIFCGSNGLVGGEKTEIRMYVGSNISIKKRRGKKKRDGELGEYMRSIKETGFTNRVYRCGGSRRKAQEKRELRDMMKGGFWGKNGDSNLLKLESAS